MCSSFYWSKVLVEKVIKVLIHPKKKNWYDIFMLIMLMMLLVQVFLFWVFSMFSFLGLFNVFKCCILLSFFQMDRPTATPTRGSKGGSTNGTPKAKGNSSTPKAKGGSGTGTPKGPTPTPPPPQVGTPTLGPIGTPTPPPPVGTPTSSASTTASCYQYPPSPIDNLMGGVDMDEDDDADEMETNRSTGSMKVHGGCGGQPPLPKKKKN
jgi:hypothetical protein